MAATGMRRWDEAQDWQGWGASGIDLGGVGEVWQERIVMGRTTSLQAA
jgi:hypothetical protein